MEENGRERERERGREYSCNEANVYGGKEGNHYHTHICMTSSYLISIFNYY